MIFWFAKSFALVWVIGLWLAAQAYAEVKVRIDSPVDGAFVANGQVIDVVVRVDGISDVDLKRHIIGILAHASFGDAVPVRVPGGFVSRLVVGSGLRVGNYPVQAVVKTLDGVSFSSKEIVLTIPRKPIVGIRSRFDAVSLSFIGDSDFVQVVGLDSEGREVPLSDADRQKLRFSVSNSAVAGIEGSGRVTARTAGLGWIYVAMGELSAAARLTVDLPSVALRGDFTGDGVVSEVDIAYLRRIFGAPVAGKGDARDLNGDGKIDALDLRTLTTLCTYPRCASTKP